MQKADHESTELCAVTYQLPAARGLGVADNTQELQIIQITKSRSYIQRCCSWEILYIKWRQKYTPLSPSSNPESHIHRSAEQLFIVKRKIPITDERNQKHTNATRNRVTPQKSQALRKMKQKMRFIFVPLNTQLFPPCCSFRVGRKSKSVICVEAMPAYYDEDTHQTSNSLKLDSASKVESSHRVCFVSKSYTHTAHGRERRKKEKKEWKNVYQKQ